jgi:phospholipid-binding lipoprotein MlaA
MGRTTKMSFYGVRKFAGRSAIVGLLAATLAGCATNGTEYRDPRDPLESFNRAMYQFNDGLDRAIIKPVAEGYKAVVPTPVDKGITNFFANLSDVRSAANNLLQLKVTRAASDVGRVLINTTVGVLGFVDVATNMNIPRYNEDFGQTLGVWGVSSGPYLVLPLFGPSSGRDAVGTVVDWYADPVNYVDPDGLRWGLSAIRVVDRRADLLGASRVLEEAALDPYRFVREGYMQRRENDVFDGNPPEKAEAADNGAAPAP